MEPIVIVCTGGIGSGKSAITNAFGALGYPVYDCDNRAKYLYDIDKKLLSDVACIVGEEIIRADGSLDKAKFAGIIFNNSNLLQQIEALVHPAVIRDFYCWKNQQNSDIVVFESALFFEKDILHDLADYVILVVADEATRIARVVKRDNISEEEVKSRMANQLPDDKKIDKADYVFYTNDTKPILPQILNIIKNINYNGKNRS